MWLNEDTYLQVGILDGIAIGFFRSVEDTETENEHDVYNFVFVCFFLKVMRWTS